MLMDVQKDVLLSDYTTFHIGGPADEFIVVTSVDELVAAIAYAHKKTLPFFVLGTGANILVGDKGFRGVVIKNEAGGFSFDGNILTVESGAVMSDLIGLCAKKGLSGLEHFAGIPSSVGGALWQNLHFLSPDRSKTMYIGDMLIQAIILGGDATPESNKGGSRDDGLKQKVVDKDYFQFGYDDSILHHNKDVVLSATFTLTPKDPQEIEDTIDANLKWREEKHPKGAVHCSAGSVFKKIEGHGAGRLIEHVGLKGHLIGGAQISEQHANFIINTGNATAQDVVNLIELVKEKVKQAFGLEMQTEISMVGEF